MFTTRKRELASPTNDLYSSDNKEDFLSQKRRRKDSHLSKLSIDSRTSISSVGSSTIDSPLPTTVPSTSPVTVSSFADILSRMPFNSSSSLDSLATPSPGTLGLPDRLPNFIDTAPKLINPSRRTTALVGVTNFSDDFTSQSGTPTEPLDDLAEIFGELGLHLEIKSFENSEEEKLLEGRTLPTLGR